MKLSIATNWDDKLTLCLKSTLVTELYGKTRDFFGGPRSSFLLPRVSRKRAELHIRKARDAGFAFNYLINATCMDNKELTMKGQKELRKLLDWLTQIGVEAITVALPYLVSFIKKNYPHFKICVSAGTAITTPNMAKYWEDFGADTIVLQNSIFNRNFRLLKEVRKVVQCNLSLVANSACLRDCPYCQAHYSAMSHASQPWHSSRGFLVDYCFVSCRLQQFANPVEIISADWIRPEDTPFYEGLGINGIKLIDRSSPTDVLERIARAYSNRHYDGNLLDLLPVFVRNNDVLKLSRLIRMLRPFTVNIFKFRRFKELEAEMPITINNRKLDNFLNGLLKEDCYSKSCQDCAYCQKVAKEVIDVDQNKLASLKFRYKALIDDISSGRMFKYF